MRKSSFAMLAIAALMLCGCAGMGAKSGRDGLASLQLFDAQSRPNFVAYLACFTRTVDEDPQCTTVTNAFYAWSNDRHVEMHVIDPDDSLFHTGRPSTNAASASTPSEKAYRLAIHFEPVVVPAFKTWGGTGGTQTSGFVPGKAGYEVTLYVFSTASGALVRKLTLHNRMEMPQHSNVTPAIKAGAYEVIKQIDPAFSGP